MTHLSIKPLQQSVQDGNALLAPVAIGGIGGSGTRLIAQILRTLGFFIGSDLNRENDNLWFTLLFKRTELLSTDQHDELPELLNIFCNAMLARQLTPGQECLVRRLASIERPQHSVPWLQSRAESLIDAAKQAQLVRPSWGWKEPNTHLFLDRLHQALPAMQYIHVMRHGLDMAFSPNRNQASLWGPFLLGFQVPNVTPAYALKYWCAAHRRVLDLTITHTNQFLLLNYDQLCSNPISDIARVVDFLGLEVTNSVREYLMRIVHRSPSMGRFRTYSLKLFDREDIDYVRTLGFVV